MYEGKNVVCERRRNASNQDQPKDKQNKCKKKGGGESQAADDYTGYNEKKRK